MMIESPCKDCRDRELHCHGKCEKYIEYKVAASDERKAIDRKRQKYTDVSNYIKERKEKARKRLKH